MAAVSHSLSPEWAAAVRGGVVELVLRPSRFVFRPLELPSRAAEFLDGIIRAQIDRLTPWNATETVFRWTRPRDVAGERIALTVVATGRDDRDFLCAGIFRTWEPPASKFRPRRRRRGGSPSSISGPAGKQDFGRTRFALIAGAGDDRCAGDAVDRGRRVHRQFLRCATPADPAAHRGAAGDHAWQPDRHRQFPARTADPPQTDDAVERDPDRGAVRRCCPNIPMRPKCEWTGDKLQIVGVTRDAPSLIQILEQSPHFSSAGFFAPTTRAANEPGERFHIEARLKPHFGSGT